MVVVEVIIENNLNNSTEITVTPAPTSTSQSNSTNSSPQLQSQSSPQPQPQPQAFNLVEMIKQKNISDRRKSLSQSSFAELSANLNNHSNEPSNAISGTFSAMALQNDASPLPVKKGPKKLRTLGEIFVSLAPYLRVYTMLINNYHNVILDIKGAKQNNQKFAEYLAVSIYLLFWQIFYLIFFC